MVDISLFASLLSALPFGCRLIMVGDSDQLPPVGAGNVLQDLINSKLLPVVELNEVFRQAMNSLIVTNAHRIVNGERVVTDNKEADFFLMERGSAAAAAGTIAELYSKRLPKAYGYSPFTDIQVICPSKKGEAGTVNLNNVLQSLVNPPEGHISLERNHPWLTSVIHNKQCRGEHRSRMVIHCSLQFHFLTPIVFSHFFFYFTLCKYTCQVFWCKHFVFVFNKYFSFKSCCCY